MRVPRTFGARWLVLSLASWLVLIIATLLFESASGSDFEPIHIHSGALFKVYHTMLAFIMGIVIWPAALPELPRAKFGITVPLSDSLVLVLVALADGLAFAGLWQLFNRLRFRRQARGHATPTI